ncbi:MAG: hypothetical protein AB1411_05015 [Nitrospirota bacterium]
MTKKEAREYVKRGCLVNEFQAKEFRRTPIAEKLRQMDACYRLAVGMGLIPKLAAMNRQQDKEARLRWRRLKGLAA